MATKNLKYAIGELESRYHDHMATLARMRAAGEPEHEIEEERKKAEACGNAVNILIAHENA